VPFSLAVTCTATPEGLRPTWRRDFAINLLLGGMYSPVARRHAHKYLSEHTLIDGTPLQSVAVKTSRVPALILVALFIALRVAAEFGHGPPMPLVIVVGVLLLPYLWATVTRRSVAAVRWREWQPRFTATWGEVYRASWPLFVLGIPWAIAETAVSAAAARAGGQLDATWIAGVVTAMAVSFPLLVRLAFEWKRLRMRRTVVDGHALHWPGTYGEHLRIWATTFAAILVCAVLPVAALRYAVLGSFTVAGLEPARATVATLAGLAIAWMLSLPVRAWHEARMLVSTWHGLRIGDAVRVECRLDVRAFVRMRMRSWRGSRPQAIVDAWRMKVDALVLTAAAGWLLSQA
jgi:hypothetical protein